MEANFGHNFRSPAWQDEVKGYSAHLAKHFDDDELGDASYISERYKTKDDITVEGVIPLPYFAVAPEMFIGEGKPVRLRNADGDNSPHIFIDHYTRPYWYRVRGAKLKQDSMRVTTVHREALVMCVEDIMWLMRYAMAKTDTQIDELFVSATGSRMSACPDIVSQMHADGVRETVYQFIQDTLQTVARRTNEKKCAASDGSEPTVKLVAGMDDCLDYAVFGSHPEVIRYFGGRKFYELSRAFSEKWLLGLKLVQIYQLHDILVTNPYLLCFSVYLPRMYATVHSYASKYDFVRGITEINLEGFAAIRKMYPGGKYPEEAYIDVVMYNAVKYLCCTHKHTYVTFDMLFSTMVENTDFTACTSAISGYEQVKLTRAKMIEAIERLNRMQCVVVIHDNELYTTAIERGVAPVASKFKIYHHWVYKTEAILVHAFNTVCTRNIHEDTLGSPITMAPLSQASKDSMCSEQTFFMDNMLKKPVWLIDGPGGGGKTTTLGYVVERLQGSILFLGWQNRHIKNLGQTLEKHYPRCRWSTIHKVLCCHNKHCRNILDGYTGEPDKYYPLLRQQQANKLAVDQAADTKRIPPVYDRVWGGQCKRCPLENLEALFFEEVSTIEMSLLAKILAQILPCAPLLRMLIFAGDPRQLSSIGIGNVIDDIKTGFGGVEFVHVHRANNASLRVASDAVNRGDPVRFEPDIGTNSIVNIECSEGTLVNSVATLIRKRKLTLYNSQFITRTNKIRHMCNTVVRNVCLSLTDGDPHAAIVRGDKIMYVGKSVGHVSRNETFLVWGVAHVVMEPFLFKKVDNAREQDTRVVEIVRVSELMDQSEGDSISNATEVIDEIASGSTYITDAMLVDNENERKQLLARGFLPLPEDVLVSMRDHINPNTIVSGTRMTDVTLLQCKPEWIASNSRDNHPTVSTQKMLVCVDITEHGLRDFPEPSVPNLLRMANEQQIQLLPYMGSDKANVIIASVVTIANIQGGSAPIIVHLAPTFSPHENRKSEYTAVTRAKDAYIAVGPRAVFDRAPKLLEQQRLSGLGPVLANVWKSYAPWYAPLDPESAALLEYEEDKDYFPHMARAPNRFIRMLKEKLGHTADDQVLDYIEQKLGLNDEVDGPMDEAAPAPADGDTQYQSMLDDIMCASRKQYVTQV